MDLHSIGEDLRNLTPELRKLFPEIEGMENEELVNYFYSIVRNRTTTGLTDSSKRFKLETTDNIGLKEKFKQIEILNKIRIA